MKNIYRIIIAISVSLFGFEGVRGQASQGDFVYSSSVSDSLQSPTRMAIDHNDNIFVTDSYQKDIKKYGPSGNLLATISPGGSPISVAVNSNNQLFAGDGSTGNILKINDDGSTAVFYSGSAFPTAMSFSPDNHLYIADSKLQRVLVLDPAGNLVQTIGAGTLVFPTGIAYDARNNRVIVGEHGGIDDNLQTRVYIFNTNGTMVTALGSYGNTNGRFYRVQGVTVGRCGNIYVCEPFQGNISVFNEGGTFITKFGEFGTGNGQLNVPMDVVFDSHDRIFLSSMNNNSVVVYSINDPLPSAKITTPLFSICNGETADINVQFTGTAPWTFTYTINDQNPVSVNNVTTNPYSLSVSQPGSYKVTALSDATTTGTCFSGSATVNLKFAATAQISNGTTNICAGQTQQIPVQLTGMPPWSVTYTKNGLNPVIISGITASPYLLEVTEPGAYEISSVAGANCGGTVLPGTAILNVNQIPSSIIPGFSETVCSGQSVNIPLQLAGSAPWTFQYTLNDINPVTVVTSDNPYILAVSDPGYYKIISLSDANCTGSNFTGTVLINTIPKPNPDFTYTTNKHTVSFSNTSTQSTIYFWKFGDNTTSHLENPVHTYQLPGTYYAALYASNDECSPRTYIKKVVVSNFEPVPVTSSTSIKNAGNGLSETEMGVSIFPNPSSGLINIEITNPPGEDMNIEITNMTGQVVYRKVLFASELPLNAQPYSGQIDLSEYSGGVYSVKLITNEGTHNIKLVLNK